MKIMKNITIFLVVLFFNLFSMFAQDDKLDSLNFEMTPVKEEKPPYFAFGGGYTGTFLMLNMDDLNAHIKNNKFGVPDMKATLYMSGAQGFTAIAVIPNVRIGFFGMGGTTVSEIKTDPATTGVSYAVSYTGFSIDYGFVPLRALAVLPGISGGWVTTTIESYQSKNTSDFTKDFKSGSDAANYLYRATGSFYFVQPNLNIEYAITKFLMARANVGYSFSFSPDWKFNGTGTLNNVPKGINANGLTLQFGVFIGIFNY